MFAVDTGRRRTFDFTLDGEAHSVTSIDSLPYRLARKLADAQRDGDAVTALDIVSGLIDEDAPGVLDQLSVAEVNDLIEAWKASGSVTEGESSASSS